MAKDSYKKTNNLDIEELKANTYKGQKPMTLRERLDQNPALKQAREKTGAAGKTGAGAGDQAGPAGNTGAPDQTGATNQSGSTNQTGATGKTGSTNQTDATGKAGAAEQAAASQQTGSPEGVKRAGTEKPGGAQPAAGASQARKAQAGAGSGDTKAPPPGRPIIQPAGGVTAAYAQNSKAAERKNTGAADSLAAELAEILEDETALYRDASEISSKKTDIIVKGKIEDLESLVKAEQTIIIKIGKLEDRREEIITRMAEELKLDIEGISLSQITEKLGEENSLRLKTCQDDLMGTLSGLKNQNETNEQLIQNALDYINFSVNLITSDRSGGINYSPEGEEEHAAGRRNIFDVKL